MPTHAPGFVLWPQAAVQSLRFGLNNQLPVLRSSHSPTQTFPQDVEPGSSARPMLATTARTTEYVFSRLKGRPFIVETKFDGALHDVKTACLAALLQCAFFSSRPYVTESTSKARFSQGLDKISDKMVSPPACALAGERMQLHRMGGEVQFFSRSGHEHGVKSSYNILTDVAKQQVL